MEGLITLRSFFRVSSWHLAFFFGLLGCSVRALGLGSCDYGPDLGRGGRLIRANQCSSCSNPYNHGNPVDFVMACPTDDSPPSPTPTPNPEPAPTPNPRPAPAPNPRPAPVPNPRPTPAPSCSISVSPTEVAWQGGDVSATITTNGTVEQFSLNTSSLSPVKSLKLHFDQNLNSSPVSFLLEATVNYQGKRLTCSKSFAQQAAPAAGCSVTVTPHNSRGGQSTQYSIEVVVPRGGRSAQVIQPTRQAMIKRSDTVFEIATFTSSTLPVITAQVENLNGSFSTCTNRPPTPPPAIPTCSIQLESQTLSANGGVFTAKVSLPSKDISLTHMTLYQQGKPSKSLLVSSVKNDVSFSLDPNTSGRVAGHRLDAKVTFQGQVGNCVLRFQQNSLPTCRVSPLYFNVPAGGGSISAKVYTSSLNKVDKWELISDRETISSQLGQFVFISNISGETKRWALRATVSNAEGSGVCGIPVEQPSLPPLSCSLQIKQIPSEGTVPLCEATLAANRKTGMGFLLPDKGKWEEVKQGELWKITTKCPEDSRLVYAGVFSDTYPNDLNQEEAYCAASLSGPVIITGIEDPKCSLDVQRIEGGKCRVTVNDLAGPVFEKRVFLNSKEYAYYDQSIEVPCEGHQLLKAEVFGALNNAECSAKVEPLLPGCKVRVARDRADAGFCWVVAQEVITPPQPAATPIRAAIVESSIPEFSSAKNQEEDFALPVFAAKEEMPFDDKIKVWKTRIPCNKQVASDFKVTLFGPEGTGSCQAGVSPVTNPISSTPTCEVALRKARVEEHIDEVRVVERLKAEVFVSATGLEGDQNVRAEMITPSGSRVNLDIKDIRILRRINSDTAQLKPNQWMGRTNYELGTYQVELISSSRTTVVCKATMIEPEFISKTLVGQLCPILWDSSALRVWFLEPTNLLKVVLIAEAKLESEPKKNAEELVETRKYLIPLLQAKIAGATIPRGAAILRRKVLNEAISKIWGPFMEEIEKIRSESVGAYLFCGVKKPGANDKNPIVIPLPE